MKKRSYDCSMCMALRYGICSGADCLIETLEKAHARDNKRSTETKSAVSRIKDNR